MKHRRPSTRAPSRRNAARRQATAKATSHRAGESQERAELGFSDLQRQVGNRALARFAADQHQATGAGHDQTGTRAVGLTSSAGTALVQRQEAPPTEEAKKPAAAASGPAVAEKSPDTPTEADKKEYKLLPKNIKNAKAKSLGTVEAYVKYRNDHFGSREAYETAEAAADAEFDKMKKSVWNRIGQRESKEAKKVLYRWLRKAYIDAGIADPVSVIKAGKTKKLAKKLGEVEKKHKALKTGGFVARPQKLKGYRLGTLSEHGKGNAVDVTPQSKNPQLTKSEWKYVLKFTGKTADLSKKRWKKSPEKVWRDVHDVNAAYVTKLKTEVEAVRTERTKNKKNPDKPPAYEQVLRGKSTLIKTAKKHGIDHGFFSLDEDLVVDFGKAGFTWGATFGSNVDLHHFEI